MSGALEPREGHYRFGEVPVEDIVAIAGTPTYAYDSAIMRRQVERLNKAFSGVPLRMAPFILLSSLLFSYFASALMFDSLLSFFVALGLLGLVRAWKSGGGAGGFGLLALGMGGALYAKGPVALLHLLPLALFAPWWMREQRPRWGRWYAGVALALLGGAALILAWAIPAAWAGGEAYRNAIFWGQTANRMVESFAHRAPERRLSISMGEPLLPVGHALRAIPTQTHPKSPLFQDRGWFWGLHLGPEKHITISIICGGAVRQMRTSLRLPNPTRVSGRKKAALLGESGGTGLFVVVAI